MAFKALAFHPRPPSVEIARLHFLIAHCLIRIHEHHRGADMEDPRDYLDESWDLLQRASRAELDPLPRLRGDLDEFLSFDQEDDEDDEEDDEEDRERDRGGAVGLAVFGRPGGEPWRVTRPERGKIWGLDEKGSCKRSRDHLRTNLLHCLLALDIQESGQDPTVPDGMPWAPFPEDKVLEEVSVSYTPSNGLSKPSLPISRLRFVNDHARRAPTITHPYNKYSALPAYLECRH